MSKPKIGPGVILFLLASVSISFAAANEESITITTYYPSPYGVYKNLRLYPSTGEPDCDANQRGLMYYNDTNNEMRVCRYNAVTSSYEWQAVGGGEV